MSLPPHPIVDAARRDSRRWSTRLQINGVHADEHAVQVALTIADHIDDPAPELLATALLAHLPAFARTPGAGLPADLWRLLAARHGPRVAAIMVALHLDGDEPAVPDDHDTLLVSVADNDRHRHRTGRSCRRPSDRDGPGSAAADPSAAHRRAGSPSMTVRHGHALAVLADRFTVPRTEPASAHRGPPDERPPPW